MISVLLSIVRVLLASQDGHASVLEKDFLVVLGAWENINLSSSSDRFNLAFSAQNCLRHSNGLFSMDVVAFSLELVVLPNLKDQDKISGAAVQSFVALVLDSQDHAVVDTGRNVNVQLYILLDDTFSSATLAVNR